MVMQTVYYILASLAAILVIIAVPVITIRVMLLMERIEDTRRDLAELIAEAGLSLQNMNRVLARSRKALTVSAMPWIGWSGCCPCCSRPPPSAACWPGRSAP